MLRLPERIHKRPFVVSIIVFLTLIVISAVLVFTLGLFGPGSNLMRVHVSAKETASSVNGTERTVDGIGINLPYLPAANLLRNPSFENIQYDQVYTVSGGSANAVYVQSDSDADSVYLDDFFVGGTVRIMSLDQDGRFIPKLQAVITDFRINQLGVFTPLTVPSGAAEGQKVNSISSSSSLSVAVGDDGLLISDVTSSDPAIIDMGIAEDFVSSSCIMDRFYAVTQSGSFVTSSDGKTWNSFAPDVPGTYLIHTVSSLGKTGIAAGDSGVILLCSNGAVTSVPSGTAKALITSAGDGTSLVIGGMEGSMITTSNGLLFRELSSAEMPVFEDTPDWLCSDYREGYFVFGGDAGQIALGSVSAETGLFSFVPLMAEDESGVPLSIEHILLLSAGEIIIMDQEGLMYCSNDRGGTWKLLSVDSTKTIDEIGQTTAGKIILSQGVTSQTTQLFTRIQFDEVQSDTVFQAGDMCFLERSAPSQNDQNQPVLNADSSSEQSITAGQTQTSALISPDNLWQCMGEATQISLQEAAPSGAGSSSLQMIGSPVDSGEQAHYVSQVIEYSDDTPFQESTLYQIKVWLKQDGIQNGEVMTWISGKFASAGTTFTDVGGAWRQYTYTFFLPTETAGTNPGEIRFNLGFAGEGVLNVDKVYFGLESNADSSLPDSFTTLVSKASPNLIRLDNLKFGQMGASSSAWVLSYGNEGLIKSSTGFATAGCNSLDASLALVHAAESDPWLVIGSSADKTTVDNLMSYLCGSISDPFGKLRIDNGTAVPWSISFSRIVIEITDSDKIFSTDLQRGAYVDYMVGLIQSSPYYVDNKNKFVFIDGMVYEGGTMLSEADYHAGNLTITNQTQTASGIVVIPFGEAVSAGYASYFDSIPRTPSRPQQGADEWIRSSTLALHKVKDDVQSQMSVIDVITAANCVEMLLSDLGDHTFTVMTDLAVSKLGADVDTDALFADQGSTNSEKLLDALNNKTMLAVCTLLRDSVYGTAIQMDVISPIITGDQKTGQTVTGTPDESGLVMYGFKYDSKIHTIIANTTDQPILFLLEADWSIKDVYVYRYSSEGIFLEKTKLGQRNNRINLLPGQVITADIPIQ